MGANITRIDMTKEVKQKKPLSPLQKKLLDFPVMTGEELYEYKKINKWMRKWKI